MCFLVVVVAGYLFFCNKKQPKLMRKAICMNNSGERYSCFSFHPEERKKNISDACDEKKKKRNGLRWRVFAEMCARPAASLTGCLSTRRQTVAAILDLLTKPGCTNTELITAKHICSTLTHTRGLSGQGLAAGNDCHVPVIGSD